MSPKQRFLTSSAGYVLNYYPNQVGFEEFDGYLSFLNERLTDETVCGIGEAHHAQNVALAANEYLEDGDYAVVPHAPLREALAD